MREIAKNMAAPIKFRKRLDTENLIKWALGPHARDLRKKDEKIEVLKAKIREVYTHIEIPNVNFLKKTTKGVCQELRYLYRVSRSSSPTRKDNGPDFVDPQK